eukprot:48306_1
MSSTSTSKQTSPLLELSQTERRESSYVDLSVEMKNKNPCADDLKRTYFIYQCGHTDGPYTVCELLGKCVRNEIHLKSEKILFCPASLTNSYAKHKVWNTLQELKHTGFHEQLCANLQPFQQASNIIHLPPAPDNAAIKHKPFGLSMHNTIRIVSVILSKLIFTFIAVHFVIPLIVCTIIYCILFICCCSKHKLDLFSPYSLLMFIGYTLVLKKSHKIYTVKNVFSSVDTLSKEHGRRPRYVATFIGFTATPGLVIALIMKYYETEKNLALISWITIYIVWCVFVIIDYFCVNLHLWYKHVTKFVIGVHITNVHKQDLLLVLSALSATLPATISGYITFYVLDERMTLRCTSDTVSDVCLEDKCCYIVSSHDAHIANVIALFATVRLLSWTVQKADTTLYDITTERF